MPANIHIGTSGWSYKHWKKVFYAEDLKPTDWLEFYSHTFSITEINTSFYHLPKIETIKTWSKKVPPDFMFCPKMSRYFSHIKKLNDPEESFQKFFKVFHSIKKKLGPILIQLPASIKFNYDKAEHLYKICKKKYRNYLFAIEARHPGWFETESIELLKKYNIALVISQSGRGFPYSELITAKHIYVRFHGPQELYASSYTNKELKYFARLFKNWEKEGHSIWAFFNNDYSGYAIDNAKSLIEMVK